MRTFEMVKVNWIDAAHYRNESPLNWFIENADTSEFSTVGYLLKQDERIIVVAHEINDDNQGRDVSVIPKVLIIKMETLISEHSKYVQPRGGDDAIN